MSIDTLKRTIWLLCIAAAAGTAALAVDAFRSPSYRIPAHSHVDRHPPFLSGPGKFDLQGLSSYAHIWKRRGLSSTVPERSVDRVPGIGVRRRVGD